ncbi:UNVERIFIED_CONTAM: hypothetical protein Sradi_3164200 [Sesamum radiatum]|uniref:Reverse transcriptase domain-containing protein n=1 Tax=Sesamum radiatum TaxID=300843 RepID=A0AAW2REI1_SESRA
MSLKLDVNKAYDKVEWSFLEQMIKDVLEVYRRASDQEINFSKSSITFSRNTKENLCLHIAAELTIRQENRIELYLGLSSKAGKEVLIKPVLDAIPAYAMVCFKLPLSLLNEIQKLIDPGTGDWKYSLVHELFCLIDSALIFSIPLSRSGDQDLLVWHYSKNGIFSIRSAYHLVCSLDNRPRSSTYSGQERLSRLLSAMAGPVLCLKEIAPLLFTSSKLLVGTSLHLVRLLRRFSVGSLSFNLVLLA